MLLSFHIHIHAHVASVDTVTFVVRVWASLEILKIDTGSHQFRVGALLPNAAAFHHNDVVRMVKVLHLLCHKHTGLAAEESQKYLHKQPTSHPQTQTNKTANTQRNARVMGQDSSDQQQQRGEHSVLQPVTAAFVSTRMHQGAAGAYVFKHVAPDVPIHCTEWVIKNEPAYNDTPHTTWRMNIAPRYSTSGGGTDTAKTKCVHVHIRVAMVHCPGNTDTLFTGAATGFEPDEMR